MRERQHLFDAFNKAIVEERLLYEVVKGCGPGMEGYDAEAWADWLDAVSATTEASKALREGFADSDPSAAPHSSKP